MLLIIAQRQRLLNILLKQRHKGAGKGRQKKRETADAQMEKGEKIGTFEIINYASHHFIYKNRKKKINYKTLLSI